MEVLSFKRDDIKLAFVNPDAKEWARLLPDEQGRTLFIWKPTVSLHMQLQLNINLEGLMHEPKKHGKVQVDQSVFIRIPAAVKEHFGDFKQEITVDLSNGQAKFKFSENRKLYVHLHADEDLGKECITGIGDEFIVLYSVWSFIEEFEKAQDALYDDIESRAPALRYQ